MAGRPLLACCRLLAALAACLALSSSSWQASASAPSPQLEPLAILTVGSLNFDIIAHIDRLPARGETVTTRTPSTSLAVGGKGANQAVAASRLAAGTGRASRFVTLFGNDSHASWLEAALREEGVDVSGCGRAPGLPSGQGLVLLESDGQATSVVVGGANTAFPRETPEALAHLMRGTGVLMLQREVPEHVNEAVAAAAAAAGCPSCWTWAGRTDPSQMPCWPFWRTCAPTNPSWHA